jgi:fucose permease
VIAGWILRSTGSWRPVYWFPIAVTGLLLLSVFLTPLPRGRSRGKRSPIGDVISPVVLLGGLTLLLYVGAEVGVSSWIVLFMRRELGFAPLVATTGLTIMWLGIMLGRFLNSLLTARVGTKTLVLGACVAGLIFGEGLLLPSSPAGMYVLLALFGLAVSGVFPHVMGEINGLFPGRTGAVTAVLTVSASAGAMVVHPLLGLTAEALSLRAAIAIPGALMGLSALSFWACVGAFRPERQLPGSRDREA